MVLATSPAQDTTEFGAIVQRLVTLASRTHPACAARLAGAARIVVQPNQPVVVYADGSATVRSESNPEGVYQVVGNTCSCPDAAHRARLCKHSLAVGLFRRAARELLAEARRRRSYGRTYEAPGTPGAFVACKACGIQALLDQDGLCPACGAEPRYTLTLAGWAATDPTPAVPYPPVSGFARAPRTGVA